MTCVLDRKGWREGRRLGGRGGGRVSAGQEGSLVTAGWVAGPGGRRSVTCGV